MHGKRCLKLCSDGGYVNGEGASAHALRNLTDGDPEIIGMGGRYLTACRSALEADALALEQGLEAVITMLRAEAEVGIIR